MDSDTKAGDCSGDRGGLTRGHGLRWVDLGWAGVGRTRGDPKPARSRHPQEYSTLSLFLMRGRGAPVTCVTCVGGLPPTLPAPPAAAALQSGSESGGPPPGPPHRAASCLPPAVLPRWLQLGCRETLNQIRETASQ